MLKKAFVFAFACVSLASWISCGKTTSHFVYAALPGPSQIAVFREDPNSGVLTAISGSPFPGGSSPHSIAVHPSGKFLYAANAGQGQNDVSLFTISSDGVPTEVTPRTTAGTVPTLLAIDAAGAFLYVANGQSNNVSVFAIDSGSGALTQVPNSPFAIGLSALDMKLNPAGTVLYVTGSPNVLAAFSLSSVGSGSMPLLARSGPGNEPDNGPFGIAIDPGGSLLFTANTTFNTISIFTLDPSGLFTVTANSPISNTSGINPLSLLVDSAGKFLYVANEGSGNITAYSIVTSTTDANTVTLNAVPTGPSFASEAQPNFLAADPNGKYLLVGGQSSAGIQSFGVDTSTGTLTSIATYSTGNNPSSIVVVP